MVQSEKAVTAVQSDKTITVVQNDKAVPVAAKRTKQAKPAKPPQSDPLDDLFQFKGEDLVKGFVFSQVLDKPRCKQRGR